MKAIETFLKDMVHRKGSDLFITSNTPPSIKVHGELEPLEEAVLTAEQVSELIFKLLSPAQKNKFLEEKELNMAISLKGVGRFRVNAYYQRSSIGMVIRHVQTDILDFKALGLPEILADLIMNRKGLVIISGGTGSGKSTTLAAMVDYRNAQANDHILCIEDPIEFIHRNKKSIVTQREVGIDTVSYETALKNGLRQSPDVVVIGEIRTQETMRNALKFSETGHLCLATIHASNASQTLDRIAHFFPAPEQEQILMDLAFNLKGIVCQNLIRPSKADNRLIPVVEVLLNTSTISDRIRAGDMDHMREHMEKSTDLGMQTFDQGLFQLYKAGVIDVKTAEKYAESKNNIRLKIKLDQGGSLLEDDSKSSGGAWSNLSIADDQKDE